MKKNKKKKVVVFGADGFIGLHLCQKLAEKNFQVTACVRSKSPDKLEKLKNKNINVYEVGNLLLLKRLKIKNKGDVNFIINLAGRAHTTESKSSKLYNFEKKSTNIEKNIKNNFNFKTIPIIQISSAKVNNTSVMSTKYNKTSYESIKLKSESYIKKNFKKYIILRPPLLYGPGVKANFLSLITLIDYGVPLPFKHVNNLRSYVFIENFIDLLLNIIVKNSFSNKIYYVKDSEAISTSELYYKITKHLNKNPKTFYLYPKLLYLFFIFINKRNLYKKVFKDFIVPDSNLTKYLSWTPKFNLEEGIKKTCFWYKSRFK